jgi:hypothetical protein
VHEAHSPDGVEGRNGAFVELAEESSQFGEFNRSPKQLACLLSQFPSNPSRVLEITRLKRIQLRLVPLEDSREPAEPDIVGG